MFWLLLGLLLLVCLVALGLSLLSLYRRVRARRRRGAGGGAGGGKATGAMSAASQGGPLDRTPCPACGAPASAATKKPAAVHR